MSPLHELACSELLLKVENAAACACTADVHIIPEKRCLGYLMNSADQPMCF